MTDQSILWNSLAHADTWSLVAVCFALGAIGGLAHSFGDAAPDDIAEPRSRFDWLRHMIVGAVAAVAVLFVIRPSDGVALVSSSLVIGYAGKATLTALQDKAKAALAQQELRVEKQRSDSTKRDMLRIFDASAHSKARVDKAVASGPSLDDVIAELKHKYKHAST